MQPSPPVIPPPVAVALSTRRTFLGVLGVLAIAPWFRPRLVHARDQQDPSQDMVSIEWELPRRYANSTAGHLGIGNDRIFAAPGAEAERGGPILVIIVAAVLLITLARAIVAIYRDLRYGGLIVQDTDRGLHIRHDRRLPGHLVIIRDRNGVTIRELRGGEVNVRDLVPILASARAAPTR